MAAGTITLTNNSTAVSGSGSSFTKEMVANDFIVAKVGGVTYTLGVRSVDSDTSVTLNTAYDGPTVTGAAWSAVSNQTLVGITAQVAADVAKTIRGINFAKDNWQQFYTASGDITVNLPDNSSVSGPSWPAMQKSLSDGIKGRASSGSNSDITELKGLTTPLSIAQGGTGAKTAVDARKYLGLGGSAVLDIGSVKGTVAAGDDQRLNSVDGKSGGEISGTVVELSADYTTSADIYGPRFKATYSNSPTNSSGTFSHWVELIRSAYLQGTLALESSWGVSRVWYFRENGNAYATSGSWVNGSDERIKDGLKKITNALSLVRRINGYIGNRDGTPFTGLIAQEVQKVLPEAVSCMGAYPLQTDINGMKKGEVIPDALAVAYGDTVGLIIESIKELAERVDAQDVIITRLLERMKSIDGLDS